MKDRISALMDGEADDKSAAQVLDALGEASADGREALETWRTYHVIGDAMRGGPMLSGGFTARVAQRLAAEPTVLAPRRIASRVSDSPRWFTFSAAAASVAAVGFVGWMAFGPQPQVGSAPLAQVQAPADARPPVIVPMPAAANDYLLAHQGFSPRVSLQGMAPYVLTVAEHPAEARK
jgi:sigma-E factor negative regulatory protein RseA